MARRSWSGRGGTNRSSVFGDEHLRVRVLRMAEHDVGPRPLDDLAAVHDEDVVAPEATRLRSCETSTTARFLRRRSSSSRSRISAARVTSSTVVGSWASKTSGSAREGGPRSAPAGAWGRSVRGGTVAANSLRSATPHRTAPPESDHAAPGAQQLGPLQAQRFVEGGAHGQSQGSSADIGSWKTTAIRRPTDGPQRVGHRPRAARRRRDARCPSPPPDVGSRPRIAIIVTVLPLPDSPTTPSRSPSREQAERHVVGTEPGRPGTGWSEPSTTSNAVPAESAPPPGAVRSPSVPHGTEVVGDAVADQVEAEHRHSDRDTRGRS